MEFGDWVVAGDITYTLSLSFAMLSKYYIYRVNFVYFVLAGEHENSNFWLLPNFKWKFYLTSLIPIFKLNTTNILLDFGTLVTESAVIIGVNDADIVHVDEPLPDDAQSQLG